SAGIEPLLDQLVDSLRGGKVLTRNTQPVARRKSLEIAVGDAGHARKRDHLAVESARGRPRLGRAQRSPVLAPEVDLVACGQRCAVDAPLATAATATDALRRARMRAAGIEID